MDKLHNADYQMLYESKPTQIDKNLERFIRKKEEALERKIAEKENRE